MQDILTPAEDLQLIANGYAPLACTGKQPAAQSWQEGVIDGDRIAAMREAYPQARNTGLRTDDMAALDIDIKDPAFVHDVVSLADEVLGVTPLCRVGSKGCCLVYRVETPSRKITILADDIVDKVEILGQGLQFIAFGIHPDTKQPYRWTRKDDFDEEANPLTVEFDSIPSVSADKIAEFSRQCVTIFSQRGLGNARVRHAQDRDKVERSASVDEDAALNVSRAIEHLRNRVEQGHVAVMGALGNDTIYELAVSLIDRYFLSEAKVTELMLAHWYPHCRPNDMEDEVKEIISHAASYVQNEPGARALPPVAMAFSAALDKFPIEDGEPGEVQIEADPGRAQDMPLIDENFDDLDLPIAGDALIEGDPPELREIVPGWMERNVNTMHEGPPATHKSRSLLQDAICIQAGMNVFGMEVEKCEVLYINYENDINELKRRVQKIRARLQPDNLTPPPDVDGLSIWNLNLTNKQILIVHRDGIRITRFGKRLIKYLEAKRDAGIHTVVIFDGLMDAIVFKDNSRNDEFLAMALIRILDLWCKQLDCTMQSIYHPGRSAERAGSIGSYAQAWSAKPRCIQVYSRILSPEAPIGSGRTKGKITEDTPVEHIWIQRRVQKRSNGVEGARMWLQYDRGGLQPHHAKKTAVAREEQPPSEVSDEVPF